MLKILTDDSVLLNYRIDDLRNPWAEPSLPVLCLHGFAKNLEWWTPCVASFANKHRVIRYDARGCGQSSIPTDKESWSLERLAKDAITVLDELSIEKVHLVTFESGGVVGLWLAANHPSRFESFAMFNTPNSKWMSEGGMNRWFSCGYKNEVEAINALGFQPWIERTLPIHVDLTVDPVIIDWVRRKVASTPIEVAKSWFKVMEKTDISDLPGRVKAPTLLVAGGEHTFGCEPPLLDEVRRQIPNAREVVYIPGVASQVQLVAPHACAAALLQFLGSLSGCKSGEADAA
jgi:3-oxoadipate enol-lactonase